MTKDIEIPEKVPLMALSDAVLFPQAIMPLLIFEPRYRKMLSDVLKSDRIFAIATLDESTAQSEDATEDEEVLHPVAGVGIIRACKKNPNGNSNLILQGIARVRFESVVSNGFYREASVHRIISEPGGSEKQIALLRKQIVDLIQTQRRLGAQISQDIFHFLNAIDEPEEMLDLAIYTLCPSTRLKLEFLEDGDVLQRFEKFASFLEGEIRRLKLTLRLRKGLEDENIANN